MKRSTLLLMASLCLSIILVRPSHSINGIAAHSFCSFPLADNDPWYWNEWLYRGKIVVVRIQNSKAVQWDTIYNKNMDQGLAEYPVLSFDGKKIAFFRWSNKITEKNGTRTMDLATTSGPFYISTINIDGTGLTNLIQVNQPCRSAKDEACAQGSSYALMDWANGDWIYYEKPTKTNEIRRINAITKVDEHVGDFQSGSTLHRFTLSIDAKYTGAMSRNIQTSGCGGPEYNSCWAFPSFTQQQTMAGCNISISTMGNFIGFYGGGNHTILFLNKWDHATNKIIGGTAGGSWQTYSAHSVEDLQQWLGEPLFLSGCSGGVEWIIWSVNSEKWLLRQVGWTDEGWNINKGSNQVAVNWVDKQAINISKNPPPPTCSYTPPTRMPTVGDLWVDFGAGNQNKWEDDKGVLHDYPFTYTQTALQESIQRPIASADIQIQHDAQGLLLTTTRRGFTFKIVDTQGKIILARTVAGNRYMVPSMSIPRAFCIVEVHASGISVSRTFARGI
jgi:hypothetical protein